MEQARINEVINIADKDKVSWRSNKRIKMSTFLSYLTVEVRQLKDGFVGASNGWTRYTGDNELVISGAKVIELRDEYLNTIEFGRKLANPYNNYVNVFYIWDILNEEGRKWALSVYAENIEKAIAQNVEKAQRMLEKAKEDAAIFAQYTAKAPLITDQGDT